MKNTKNIRSGELTQKMFFEWNDENKKLSEHISDDQWKRFSE
nr:hypothetical protein [Mycoplasmopsis bovis]